MKVWCITHDAVKRYVVAEDIDAAVTVFRAQYKLLHPGAYRQPSISAVEDFRVDVFAVAGLEP